MRIYCWGITFTYAQFSSYVYIQEEDLDRDIQSLATEMAPLYKWLAPKAYANQVWTFTKINYPNLLDMNHC